MRLATCCLVLLALLPGCLGGAEDPPRVTSMAALGDSITMAANPDRDRFGDNPGHSWATGVSDQDRVQSHAERLSDALGNRSWNLARSGARMADLPRQADAAVERGARYVTILMGGNDLCAGSVEGMTPVETYRAQFREAARRLDEGLAEDAVVYVVSVPDVAQLREKMWDVPEARWVWRNFHVCQALLAEGATEADVAAVRERNVAYNRVLREESENFGFHFDDEAVYREEVSPERVSPLDFFHPSLEGQRRLAEVTWRAGPPALRG